MNGQDLGWHLSAGHSEQLTEIIKKKELHGSVASIKNVTLLSLAIEN